MSFTDWYQPLWEETVLLAPGRVSKGSTRAAAGPSQAAASPCNTLTSASTTTQAIVASDLDDLHALKLQVLFELTGAKWLYMCNNTSGSKAMVSLPQKER